LFKTYKRNIQLIIKDIDKVPLNNKIYGDISLYDMSQKPLSVKQMSKNYINYMMMFLNKKINLLIIKFKIYI
jgi:hypothetical protein